ncbi:phasin family protein [Alkalimarinus sediminis]|uniref:Phasin family protein n=1 Tax=Alkalimarinus sediminis TaxID=1632866 RepID=A0A9E8KRK4_9ALTE|nr:phasin family protein [Alkalimarinus sediminis]UZW76177.1 phasin family protein [Alkalimarinus sediminis]
MFVSPEVLLDMTDKDNFKDTRAEELSDENQLSNKIKDSARQIWLAGLGAYNKAEEDAGKIFDKLVKEGEEIEHMTRGVVEKRIKVVEDTVEGVKEKANGTIGKLESVFDQRVSKALQKMGIPTRAEIKALEAQIEELKKQLKEGGKG